MVKPVRIDLLKAILQNDAGPIAQVKGKQLHASRGQIEVGKEGRWFGRNVTLKMADGSEKLLDESSIKKFFKNHHTHIPEYLKNNLDKKGNVQKALNYYAEHLVKEDVDMSKKVAALNTAPSGEPHLGDSSILTRLAHDTLTTGGSFGAFLGQDKALYIAMPGYATQQDITSLMDKAVHSLTDRGNVPSKIVIIGDDSGEIRDFVDNWKLGQQEKQDPAINNLSWHLANGGVSGTRNKKIAMLSGLEVVDKPLGGNLEWVSLKKNEDRQLIGLHLYRAESGYYLYAKGEDGSTKLTKEKFAKLMNEAADLLPVGCNIVGVVGDDEGLALFNEWRGE